MSKINLRKSIATVFVLSGLMSLSNDAWASPIPKPDLEEKEASQVIVPIGRDCYFHPSSVSALPLDISTNHIFSHLDAHSMVYLTWSCSGWHDVIGHQYTAWMTMQQCIQAKQIRPLGLIPFSTLPEHQDPFHTFCNQFETQKSARAPKKVFTEESKELSYVIRRNLSEKDVTFCIETADILTSSGGAISLVLPVLDIFQSYPGKKPSLSDFNRMLQQFSKIDKADRANVRDALFELNYTDYKFLKNAEDIEKIFHFIEPVHKLGQDRIPICSSVQSHFKTRKLASARYLIEIIGKLPVGDKDERKDTVDAVLQNGLIMPEDKCSIADEEEKIFNIVLGFGDERESICSLTKKCLQGCQDNDDRSMRLEILRELKKLGPARSTLVKLFDIGNRTAEKGFEARHVFSELARVKFINLDLDPDSFNFNPYGRDIIENVGHYIPNTASLDQKLSILSSAIGLGRNYEAINSFIQSYNLYPQALNDSDELQWLWTLLLKGKDHAKAGSLIEKLADTKQFKQETINRVVEQCLFESDKINVFLDMLLEKGFTLPFTDPEHCNVFLNSLPRAALFKELRKDQLAARLQRTLDYKPAPVSKD